MDIAKTCLKLKSLLIPLEEIFISFIPATCPTLHTLSQKCDSFILNLTLLDKSR